jgi:Arc/MetJ-type ribon-helix-helix transcriptional regulator
MVAGLHRARRQLVDETRESDDATAVRVDALLARLREDGAR